MAPFATRRLAQLLAADWLGRPATTA